MSDVRKIARERCARRLKAVAIAELMGTASVDRYYKQLRDKPIGEMWLEFADALFEAERLLLQQIESDPHGKLREKLRIVARKGEPVE
jgi:hypothetical protein